MTPSKGRPVSPRVSYGCLALVVVVVAILLQRLSHADPISVLADGINGLLGTLGDLREDDPNCWGRWEYEC
jgi:hypothetical protein